MDVEKVQKINTLALDLLKQGLVQDREEAVIEAERILSKKDFSSLRETMDKKGPNTESKEKELGQDKIKEILEKNTIFMVEKIKGYQESIETLKGEVSSLKNEVLTIKGKLDELRAEKRQEGGAKKEPQQKLEGRGSGGGSSANHPRSGNFKTEDVSIEKFFYSGSKVK